MGNLEWLHAGYTSQVFSPHFHKGHVVGVIERGVLGFDYRGQKVTAAAGEINMADPGEVHNGFAPAEGGWQYRMFYLGEGQLDRICNELCDHSMAMPFFKKGVIRDQALAGEIYRLHMDFENPGIPVLEKESRFHMLMVRVIMRHAPENVSAMPAGKENNTVNQIKSYIQANYDTDVRLDDLGRITGRSRYHLLRVFSKQTGLTPHAYLNLTRAAKAKEFISRGMPIIDTALTAGFYDQSHLNRVFKKIYGITPGQYNQAVMPAA